MPNVALIENEQAFKTFISEIKAGRCFSNHHEDEQIALANILPAMLEIIPRPFPMEIEHRDKPDFALNTINGVISVEVVRFLSPSLAHATATANRMKTGFNPTRFEFGPKRTRPEMEQAVVAPMSGLADFRPIFDPAYVDEFVRIIEDKRQKVLIDASIGATDNWLLIHDGHNMSESIAEFVCQSVCDWLKTQGPLAPFFTHILFHSSPLLFDMIPARLRVRRI